MKKGVIVIIISIVLITSAIVISVSDNKEEKQSSKETQDIKDKEPKEEIKQLELYELKDGKQDLNQNSLINSINMFFEGNKQCTNGEEYYIETFFNDKKVTAADLNSNYIYSIIESRDLALNNKEKVSLFIIDLLTKEYFVDEVKIDINEIVNNRCSLYNVAMIDQEQGTYGFTKNKNYGNDCGCVNNHKLYKIEGINLENDILTYKVKVIFKKDEKYYSNYEKTNLIGDEYNKELFEEADNYLFTLKIVNGNVRFLSSEKATN